MTKVEAIEEINKAFEPAFANYIITALTEGATVSDKALEQEPKTGHWISVNTGKPSCIKDGMVTESVRCSECDEWLTASDEYACYGRYCPNCGARMESEV